MAKEEDQTKSTVVVKEEDGIGRGKGLVLDRGTRDRGDGGEQDHSNQGLRDALQDVLEDVELEGVLEEVHL